MSNLLKAMNAPQSVIPIYIISHEVVQDTCVRGGITVVGSMAEVLRSLPHSTMSVLLLLPEGEEVLVEMVEPGPGELSYTWTSSSLLGKNRSLLYSFQGEYFPGGGDSTFTIKEDFMIVDLHTRKQAHRPTTTLGEHVKDVAYMALKSLCSIPLLLNTKECRMAKGVKSYKVAKKKYVHQDVTYISTTKYIGTPTKGIPSDVKWENSWIRRGCWVTISPTSIGKDRDGNRNQLGRTWRTETICKADLPLNNRPRLIKDIA